jgi:hypothetical protein
LFLFAGERVLERVNTRPWVRLALGFIQKYLKTLLDNRSRSQYCSRRQQELSAFQSKSVTAGKYRSADVT